MFLQAKGKICLLLFVLASPLFTDHIHWESEYSKAVKVSKRKKKPLLMFFTGTDWCPWCVKMSKEVFENPQFVEKANSLFVFLKVEFPVHWDKEEMIEKNQNLKTIYKVDGFPTIVLVDPKQGLISKLGYLPIGGEKYAEHLEGIVTNYYAILDGLKHMKQYPELEKLYLRAKNLGSEELAEQIFTKGINEDPGPFFLLEQYTQKVEEGMVEEEETKALRIEIQSRDPKNIWGSHFRLAMLDFQTFAERSDDPEKAVRPLLDYIERFGRGDRDNLWRLQMMISQFLFSKGLTKDALYHARASYKAAPEIARKEIAESIVYLKSQVAEE